MRLSLLLASFVAGSLVSTAAFADASVARGDYLVNSIMGCGNCHTPQGPKGPDDARKLSGQVVDDSPQMHAVARNLTPASRIAKWSDAELARAIREGIRPDGSLIGPPMPFEVYKGISDTDLKSIVMYLRTIPAVENDPGESKYNIPLPPAYGPPVTHVADVPEGPTAEYGAYLAGPLGHCIVCHTPMNEKGMAQFETSLGAGGNHFPGPWGESVSANITPTGLKHYTDDELKALIRTSTRPDGSHLMPPMPSPYFYAKISDNDISAIVAYLRSLPPKD